MAKQFFKPNDLHLIRSNHRSHVVKVLESGHTDDGNTPCVFLSDVQTRKRLTAKIIKDGVAVVVFDENDNDMDLVHADSPILSAEGIFQYVHTGR